MKRHLPLVLVLACCATHPDLSPSPLSAFAPQTFMTPRGEAQNVRFDQGENGIITIVYDLISPEPRAVFTVKLEASMDMGSTFNMPMQSISGDVGTEVRPGRDKRIVWEAAKDVERVQIDRLRFRIVATGGPLAIETPTVTARDIAPAPAPTEPEPQPVAASPVASPPLPAEKKGGSKAKWLIPLVAVGGAGGVLATRGGSDAASPTTTTTATTSTTTTTTPPATTPVQCQYSVSPLSFSVIAVASSSGQVAVSTTSGCAWTASSNASFLSVTGSTSFVGSGSASFSVESNSTTSGRTGTLSVAGQSVTVSQDAPPPDSMSIVSLSPAAGATITAGSASVVGVTVTLRYALVSRARAFVCVAPLVAVAPSANPTECGPVEVRQGTGTAVVRFSILATARDLPLTTTQLTLFMADTAQFGAGTFFRGIENAIFNWRRPGAP